MPKCLEGSFALGGLAVLALWLFVGLPFLYYPTKHGPGVQAEQQTENRVHDQRAGQPPSSRPKGEHQEQHTGEEGTEFWPPLFGYRLKITDTLIALFTAGLFVATWWLYGATRRLVEGAEETAELQLRAYITKKKFEWEFVGDRPTHTIIRWIFTPHWENSGQTPTRFARSHVSYVTRIGGLPADFDFPDAGDSVAGPMTIPPKNVMWGPPIPIGVEYLQMLRNQQARAFFWGWVDYNDIFEDTPRRRTEFCFELLVAGDPLAEDCRFSFRLCGPFNGIDNECYRQPTPHSRIENA